MSEPTPPTAQERVRWLLLHAEELVQAKPDADIYVALADSWMDLERLSIETCQHEHAHPLKQISGGHQ